MGSLTLTQYPKVYAGVGAMANTQEGSTVTEALEKLLAVLVEINAKAIGGDDGNG